MITCSAWASFGTYTVGIPTSLPFVDYWLHNRKKHIPVNILPKYWSLFRPDIWSRRRSPWLRGLRCRSAAARLLDLHVRIAPGACMSVVSFVCCQVEVSASGRSLVQRSPTDCGAPLCVIVKPRQWGSSGLLGAIAPWKKINLVTEHSWASIIRLKKKKDRRLARTMTHITNTARLLKNCYKGFIQNQYVIPVLIMSNNRHKLSEYSYRSMTHSTGKNDPDMYGDKPSEYTGWFSR
jgi:hypothetical protein